MRRSRSGFAWRALSGSARAGAAAGRAGNAAGADVRASLKARKGIVGPYDGALPPEQEAAVLDYRGLAPLNTINVEPWTYTLGRLREPRGRWKLTKEPIGITAEAIDQHAAIIGPTTTGKTSSLVVPWVYDALASGRSVLTVDVKGDLLDKIKEYTAVRGPLGVPMHEWNPASAALSWRWIDELTTEDRIEVAVEAILGKERENDPNPYHHRRDSRFLRALLTLAQNHSGIAASDLLNVFADQYSLDLFLQREPHSRAVADLQELRSLYGDQYSSAASGVLNALSLLSNDAARRISERPGLKLEHLDREPSLLVAVSPAEGGESGKSLLALLLAIASQRWLGSDAHSRVPVMMMLDEAPRIQDRLRIPELLSLGASKRLAVVLAAQDVSQFSEEERQPMLVNCGTVVLLKGSGPVSTEFLSERLGERRAVSVSNNSGMRFTDRTRSAATDRVAVIGHNEVSNPPFDGRPAIVHARSVSNGPLLVDLTRDDLLRA